MLIETMSHGRCPPLGVGAMAGAGSGVWLDRKLDLGREYSLRCHTPVLTYVKLLDAPAASANDFAGGNNGDLSGSKGASLTLM